MLYFKHKGCYRAGNLGRDIFLVVPSPGDDKNLAGLGSFDFSGTPGGASWVRKYGNPSMREILVKASGMARGRVRLRRTACAAPDDILT